jgi:hypothetical protein
MRYTVGLVRRLSAFRSRFMVDSDSDAETRVKTADLIRSLASGLAPVKRHQARTELCLGLSLGAVVSLAILIAIYGVKPELLRSAHGEPTAIKICYALWITGIAVSTMLPILRAGGLPEDREITHLIAPAAVLGGIALLQTATSKIDVETLWLGSSWQRCSLLIAGLSIPILAGACWASRRQVPLHLRTAGSVAGLISGGIASSIYALACNEDGVGFVLIWYTLGIAISAAIGAMIGPRLMRW